MTKKDDFINQVLTLGAEIGQIEINLAESKRKINQAAVHLVSAERVKNDDFEATLQLAYDACRKSIQALLAANGLRVKRSEGNHYTFVQVSRFYFFDQEAWSDFNWMKDRRNDAEYANLDAPEISAREAHESLEAAKSMVADSQKLFEELLTE